MTEENKQKVTVVGLGNMGGSLVHGLIQSGWHGLDLQVYDRNPKLYEVFGGKKGVTLCRDLEDVSLQGSVLLLCVKPQDLKSVALSMKGELKKASMVISILAGQTLAQLEEDLDYKGPIVRAMPNIAATALAAATVLSGNEACKKKDEDLAARIFDSVGEAYWAKESLMDAVTGLSGSGPAYIYMVIEALTDGGVNMGLPRDLASNLATQTVLGAATLVKESKLHPALLKDQVTTPAGTTISALVELESHGLRSMFVSAVVAATERSRALGKKK